MALCFRFYQQESDANKSPWEKIDQSVEVGRYDDKRQLIRFMKQEPKASIQFQLIVMKSPLEIDLNNNYNQERGRKKMGSSILSSLFFSSQKTLSPSTTLRLSVAEIDAYNQSVKYFVSIRPLFLEVGGSEEAIENLFHRLVGGTRDRASSIQSEIPPSMKTEIAPSINSDLPIIPTNGTEEVLKPSSSSSSGVKVEKVETVGPKRDKRETAETTDIVKNISSKSKKDGSGSGTISEEKNTNLSPLNTVSTIKVTEDTPLSKDVQKPLVSTDVPGGVPNGAPNGNIPDGIVIPDRIQNDTYLSSEGKANRLVSVDTLERRLEKFHEDDRKSRLDRLKGITSDNLKPMSIEAMQARLNKLKGVEGNPASLDNNEKIFSDISLGDKDDVNTILEQTYQEIRLESGHDLHKIGISSEVYPPGEDGEEEDDFETFLNEVKDNISNTGNNYSNFFEDNTKLPSKGEIESLLEEAKQAKELDRKDNTYAPTASTSDTETSLNKSKPNEKSSDTYSTVNDNEQSKISDEAVNSLIQSILLEPAPSDNIVISNKEESGNQESNCRGRKPNPKKKKNQKARKSTKEEDNDSSRSEDESSAESDRNSCSDSDNSC